jgi:hypothetical protein
MGLAPGFVSKAISEGLGPLPRRPRIGGAKRAALTARQQREKALGDGIKQQLAQADLETKQFDLAQKKRKSLTDEQRAAFDQQLQEREFTLQERETEQQIAASKQRGSLAQQAHEFEKQKRHRELAEKSAKKEEARVGIASVLMAQNPDLPIEEAEQEAALIIARGFDTAAEYMQFMADKKEQEADEMRKGADLDLRRGALDARRGELGVSQAREKRAERESVEEAGVSEREISLKEQEAARRAADKAADTTLKAVSSTAQKSVNSSIDRAFVAAQESNEDFAAITALMKDNTPQRQAELRDDLAGLLLEDPEVQEAIKVNGLSPEQAAASLRRYVAENTRGN